MTVTVKEKESNLMRVYNWCNKNDYAIQILVMI